MRILLDECVDWRLASQITGHEVFTVHQMSWSGTSNGELLLLAADKFDIFLTVDRNLSFQQAIRHLEIAVVILRARTNRLSDLQLLMSQVLNILPDAQKGRIIWVGG